MLRRLQPQGSVAVVYLLEAQPRGLPSSISLRHSVMQYDGAVSAKSTVVIHGFADHAKTRQLLSCSSRTYAALLCAGFEHKQRCSVRTVRRQVTPGVQGSLIYQ